MDFVKIKHMVRENGDKVIFMENGEPELVMMSFVEYEKLARLHLSEAKERVHAERHVTMQTTLNPVLDDGALHSAAHMNTNNEATLRQDRRAFTPPLSQERAGFKDGVKTNEQLPKEVEDDTMHETEFLAPVESVQVRVASLNGYDRIGGLAVEESRHAADIRLEDLPI